VRRHLATTGLALVVLPTLACLEPTQVTLSLSTDVPCSRIRDVTISEANGAGPFAETSTCSEGGQLGTLVLVPSGAGGGGTVEVVATLDVGTIVARRRVRYVSHTQLTMAIQLTSSCANILCSVDQTCANGRCVSIDTTCQMGECSLADSGTSD
jgi:hypothetical protein